LPECGGEPNASKRQLVSAGRLRTWAARWFFCGGRNWICSGWSAAWTIARGSSPMGGRRRGRAEAGVCRGERRADRAQLYAPRSPLHHGVSPESRRLTTPQHPQDLRPTERVRLAMRGCAFPPLPLPSSWSAAPSLRPDQDWTAAARISAEHCSFTRTGGWNTGSLRCARPRVRCWAGRVSALDVPGRGPDRASSSVVTRSRSAGGKPGGYRCG